MKLTFQWEDGQSAISTLTKAVGLRKVTHDMEMHRKQSWGEMELEGEAVVI